ncbi:helix-turn-helix domain-containing protein [Pseudomonas sp. NPDC087346]|uniref:helix-turn-helix domain-containing protein n=1 Tax=Pseudomonas sp. NPDC087346 TaxID=3364438 RepID=UPI00380DA357
MINTRLQKLQHHGEERSNNSTQRLRLWIRENGVRKSANKGEKIFSTNKRSVIWIESGAWQMLIGTHKTMNIIYTGGITWLDNSPSKNAKETIQYNIIERTTYYELHINQVALAALPCQVFDSLFDLVSRHSRDLSNKWLFQCTSDSYQKIKASLEWINSLPCSIKSELTLIFLINATTGVSRSHALAIIKSLKEGDYIEVYQGCLVRILKKLPCSY